MFTAHIFMCLIIHIKPMLSIGIFYRITSLNLNYLSQQKQKN